MDRGYARALRRQQAPRVRIELGRSIEVAFRLLGWLAVSGLTVAGMFVIAFAALGNFTLEGFFAQLANLATRYGEADAARRATFSEGLLIVVAIGLAATMVFRRGSLLRVFSRQEEE